MNKEDQLIDDLADLLVPRLIQRGFVVSAPRETGERSPDPAAYDSANCARFVDPHHIGDGVLRRARFFFGEIASGGEIGSVELADALDLKGPRSIPANLTIPLKKSAWRLGLEQPWEGDESGPRTIWRDRGGIAQRMVEAIDAELVRRGLA